MVTDMYSLVHYRYVLEKFRKLKVNAIAVRSECTRGEQAVKYSLLSLFRFRFREQICGQYCRGIACGQALQCGIIIIHRIFSSYKMYGNDTHADLSAMQIKKHTALEQCSLTFSVFVGCAEHDASAFQQEHYHGVVVLCECM